MDLQSAAPNCTVYINNLNEKTKVDDLKRALYFHFCTFGSIVELHASKTHRLRGQAWVVFEQLSSAVKAVRDMNGFDFLGKPMRCQFARSKSDVIAKADGTFVPRNKRVATDEEKGPKKKKRSHNGGGGGGTSNSNSSGMDLDVKRPEINPPNPILFVENLPASCDSNIVTTLFGQFPGLVEANMVPGDAPVAFVEFRDVSSATAALTGLQGHTLGEHTLRVSYTRS